MPPDTATTLRLDRGEPLVTDGPFVEGKEVVSGYAEIEAADLNEAPCANRTAPAMPNVPVCAPDLALAAALPLRP